MKILFPILLFLTSYALRVNGQIRLSGTITDATTGEPVHLSSVYVDGTTMGTTSDASGNYSLMIPRRPFLLVVSHISYQTKSHSFSDSIPESYHFSLSPREQILPEIDILDDSHREENLETFRKNFLGEDVWGKYAWIKNEEELFFTKEFRSISFTVGNTEATQITDDLNYAVIPNDDSLIVWHNDPVRLTAYAHEPLTIELPLLGYTIEVNLVDFILEYDTTRFSYLSSFRGYYHYKPIPFTSKRDSIRICRNRQKAYYHSPLHFCRSLYNKELAKNGYVIFEKKTHKTPPLIELIPFDVYPYMSFEKDFVQLSGLADKNFVVQYRTTIRQKPADLTKSAGFEIRSSSMRFLNDSVIVRDNGTTPGNSIAFGPGIGSKLLGAQLPDDYML
ncbi:MAG TPA: carboxypeptidase-like regulatory domain-containing protein [Prolixibacteraceae bacterium]|nr:carboxypeptidase-like regulatory domain-containing protein [Prolixibacteraceae bacterium]